MIVAYTDYPFTELGDTACQKAPIREVRVGCYDLNKYVDVYVDGMQFNIKRGYVYTSPGRCGEVPCVTHAQLVQNNYWIQCGPTDAAND
jgi:hypothetical protein